VTGLVKPGLNPPVNWVNISTPCVIFRRVRYIDRETPTSPTAEQTKRLSCCCCCYCCWLNRKNLAAAPSRRLANAFTTTLPSTLPLIDIMTAVIYTPSTVDLIVCQSVCLTCRRTWQSPPVCQTTSRVFLVGHVTFVRIDH